MADIRDSSGVSMRRLYSLYPTKADLISGWLRHRHDTWTAWLSGQIETGINAGSTGSDAVFDAIGSWLVETDYRGCGFINTLIEANDLSQEQREIIQNHKAQLVDRLATLTSDPAAMAVLIDGAIVQAAIFKNLEPVAAARRAAAVLTISTLTVRGQTR